MDNNIGDKRRRRGGEHPNFGRKQSEEQRERHRQWMLANAPNRGLPKTDETKQRIREARKRQLHPRFVERGITQAMVDDAVAKGLRWCAGECKAFLPSDAFSPKVRMCRKCQASYIHRYKNRTVHNVSQEQYERMVKEQDGLCAVCRGPQVPFGDRLCLDHNHATGQVRGLLCRQCNYALERFDEVTDFAMKALAYLAHYADIK